MNRTLSWLRRGLTALVGALLLVCGVYLALQALTLVPAVVGGGAGLTWTLDLGPEPVPWRLAWVAAGVAAAIIGGLLLVASVARDPGRERWVTLEKRRGRAEGNTVVRVSGRALRAMVARMVEALPGVRDSEPSLVLARGGWRVECPVYVGDEPDLPDVIAAVEDTLRRGIERQTGHPVRHVEVRAQVTPFNPKERVV